MSPEERNKNIPDLVSLLSVAGLIDRQEANSPTESLVITTLTGDGSNRQFWRISRHSGEKLFLAAAPPVNRTDRDWQEARAAHQIGTHLHARGIPVPAQYGWNEASGLLLFEDLGDVKLHDLVAQNRNPAGTTDWSRCRPQILPLYTQAVEQLALMQVRGAEGFDNSWCWDTPFYDYTLMISRESDYFLRAFWQDFLDQEAPPGIGEEFAHIASTGAQAAAHFFLHRDFQSRNIMVCDGRVRFIDFQGGRRGPLGYDLASLLIDPYTTLPISWQEELLQTYLQAISSIHCVNPAQFSTEYNFLALQRNLQIIGAFSFLSNERGKSFFSSYIIPSLVSLAERLRMPALHSLQILPRMVDKGLKLLGHAGS